MKRSTKILGVLALIVIGVAAFLWGRQSSQSDLDVELSKQTYNKGGEVRVTIQNNTLDKVCFSSCYPYYLQKRAGDWQSYTYPDCPEEDLNVPCVSSGESKEFEFTLGGNVGKGVHRIAIPVNKKGTGGEEFEEDKKVYSEAFDVK